MKKESNPNIVVGSNKRPLLPRLKLPKSKKQDPNKPQLVQFDNSAATKPVAAPNRRPLVVAGIVVLAIILAPTLFSALKSAFHAPPKTQACKEVVNNKLLHSPVNLLNPQNSSELKKTIQQLQATSDYNKSQDCLNLTVVYYTNISDYNNAKSYLDKLNKIYNAKQGFIEPLSKNGKTIEALRAAVDNLQKRSDAIRKTFRGVGNPTNGGTKQ